VSALHSGGLATEVVVSNRSFLRLGAAAFAVALAACSEHADVSLTPAQQKKVEAALVSSPSPQHKVGAVIEDQVRLVGYDLDRTEVAPGETFTISYYVEALADSMADNKVFVHFQGR
jgi:hypothetical protein